MLSAKPGDSVAGSALRMRIRSKGLFRYSGMLTCLRLESMAPRRYQEKVVQGLHPKEQKMKRQESPNDGLP